jgi:osmotically-inducible protein OsmY
MILISKILAPLFIMLGLIGCDPVSLAVSAGASTGIAAHQERGIKGLARDTAIEAKIFKQWIDTDKSMATRMSVEVYESRVLLTGITKTEEERAIAVGLAWKTNGVEDVMNEIVVGEASSFIEIARDIAITAELKSRITFNAEILAVNYAIETTRGTVFLLGIAQDEAELNRIIELANNISYVKRVVSHVRVKKPKAKVIEDHSS